MRSHAHTLYPHPGLFSSFFWEQGFDKVRAISKMEDFARGGTLRPKMFFFVLLGQVALTCRFQAQLCYVDFNAAELETCKLWPPASAAVARTLLFEQPYAVSDQPEH